MDSIVFGPLSGVLIFAVFGIKVLCTVSIGRIERNLDGLLRRLKEVQHNYTIVHDRREAMDNMHSFHEKRKIEINGEIEDLNEELRELEAELEAEEAESPDSASSHDEEPEFATADRKVPTAAMTASVPETPEVAQVETYTTSTGSMASSDAIAILPERIEEPDDLFLPDTLADQLSVMGFNVVQRTDLTKKLELRGVALTVVLKSKEYLKLGDLGRLDKVALVRSTLEAGQVLQADCQVIDLMGNNKVVLHTTVGSSSEDAENTALQSLEKTAHDMAEQINDSVH